MDPRTGLPYFDESLIGSTIASITPATRTSTAVLHLKPPKQGAGMQAIYAGTPDNQNDHNGSFETYAAGPDEFIGKTITTTGIVLWKSGEPIAFVKGPLKGSLEGLLKAQKPQGFSWEAEPGDKLSVCWAVGGLRGFIFPVMSSEYNTDDDDLGPTGAQETYADGGEFGAEWAVHTFRKPPSRKERALMLLQAASAEAARRCKCGNFKTRGMADDLCNGCRAKPTSGAASTSGSTSVRSTGTGTAVPAQSPTRTAFSGAGNRLGGGSGGGGDATATQAHGKKRARVEGQTATSAEDEYAGMNTCPRCNVDLCDRGPLRTRRHVEKCNGT